jgi:branched-chain amino acid aminotransferase
MIAFLNGRFLPEEQAVVSILDRGFLYGDGLFETIRVCRGVPFRWLDHQVRLEQGARLLRLTIPCPADELRAHADQLIRANQMPEALLRLTISRGVGPRGYSPKGANQPTLAMTLHPAPELNARPNPQWRVVTSSIRLPADEPLARFKTCNKLPQIMARAEAESTGADEALLLNTNGHVVEASTSNLFWIADNTFCTPPLASGILAGVTRTVVLELCRHLGWPTRESGITPSGLLDAQAIFLSLSSWGVVEVTTLDGQPVARSPLIPRLQAAYAEALLSATFG